VVNKELFDSAAWFIAIGVSEFISAPISEIDSVDQSRLLELRVFDKNHEIKRIRGSLCDEFQERDSGSDEYKNLKSRIETQYLDIEKYKDGGIVKAIAGGLYRLPEDNPDRIDIEHFYKADENGFYKPFDFRIVRFLKKVKKGEK
jgi:hypothetical protein